MVVNYSREGICLRSEQAPDIGTELKFSCLSKGRTLMITGASRWTIDQNGSLLTGCELTNDMGYAISGITTSAFKNLM